MYKYKIGKDVDQEVADRVIKAWKEYLQDFCWIDHRGNSIDFKEVTDVALSPDGTFIHIAGVSSFGHKYTCKYEVMSDTQRRLINQQIYHRDAIRLVVLWRQYIGDHADEPAPQDKGCAVPDPKVGDPNPVLPIPGLTEQLTEDGRLWFMTGVSRLVKYLVSRGQEPRPQDVADFWDFIRVPTVKCSGCQYRVPIERTNQHDGMYVGIDCCAEKLRRKLEEDAKA